MKHMKKVLSWMLIMCMTLSLASVNVSAEEISSDSEIPVTDVVSEDSETVDEPETKGEITKALNLGQDDDVEQTAEIQMEDVIKSKSVPLNTNSLYKIFHLDAGRKYFSVDQIKSIIDTMAENDYNTLELAVGNDGLRFLLDDMSVMANGITYESDAVKAGIQKGNRAYCDCGTNELTESEMDSIIGYAREKEISVIPLVNTPGHMDAIVTLMEELEISNPAYNNSSRTVDVTNTEAVNFTLALVNKYITYFAAKGSTIFNMGCDEYANDIYSSGSMGFGNLVSAGKYGNFITYVNSMAAQVQNAGMTAMAFNDGFYFNGNIASGTFDTDIAIAFWSSGWSGYTSMSASELAQKGHAIINTNGDWYYVLGRSKINEVTDNINKTAYNSVMGSGTMDVAGCMVCFWCDTPSYEYSSAETANLGTQITSFAKANPSVFTISADGSDSEVTEEKTVTISVGSTYNVVADSDNVVINTSETNSAFVTVGNVQESGSGYVQVDSITSGGQYLFVNQNDLMTTTKSTYGNTNGLTCEIFEQSKNYDNYLWTITKVNGGYTVQSKSGKYLNIATSSGNGNVTLSDTPQTLTVVDLGDTFTFVNGSTYLDRYNKTFAAGWGGAGVGSSNPNEIWSLYEYKSAYEIPLTGVAEGTTYVTIGNTRYTINVVAEDLSKISDLTLEYWITNGRPTDSNGGKSVSVKAVDAYSEDGIAVTGIVPVNTTKENRTLQYWRCRLLDKTKSNSSTSSTEEQTETAGDDETYNGTEFTKIRYWNGNWAVYTDNKEWVNITSNYQLVAYYLEILPVADELTVTAADWGKKGDGTTSGDYLDPQYSCTVSVQVIYEDGTTNPASTAASDLKSSTIAYGYWTSGRGVGTLNLTGLEGYQIWKVEAETGSEYYTSSSSTWGSYTVNNFTWDNNAMTVYEGDPVDSYIIHNDANNPSKEGYYQNLMWDENYEAILVKVYVKAKPTEDTLKVIYYDEKFNDELYSYNINVNSDIDFDNITPEPSEFTGNAARIDVTNCGIKNLLGVTQKFQTDLTQVPEAQGKYNSELYTYTGSVISEDRKTLYLYYNINTEVLSPMYVADFGLKITFPLSDVVGDGKTALVKEVTPTEKTRYGTLTYDSTREMFTYIPTKVLVNIDVLSISILFDEAQEATTTNCGVMPATTVFYEEGFAEYSNGWTGASKGTGNQEKEIGGKKINNYGYDSAYANTTGASNDSQATSSTKGSSASFAFTGTGVDTYANCSSATGVATVQIRNAEGRMVKLATVTTMATGVYGNEVASGAYNTPIVSVNGLLHGDYTEKVIVADGTINLDGFRVYGTLSDEVTNEVYKSDLEDNPSYFEMRDAVLTAKRVNNGIDSAAVYAQVYKETDGKINGVVVLSGASVADDPQTLLNDGPKNELYLAKDQALVFKVDTDRKVQLGLKAPAGATTYTIVGKEQTINSSTDMFYSIDPGTITITNTGDNVLSITDLKICDEPNATFGELNEEDFTDALVALGVAESEVTYADASLTVQVNDVTTVLTQNGVAGEIAIFTADEIKMAAETLVADGHTLDDAEYTDVEVVYGESDTVSFTASEDVVEQEPTNIFKQIIKSVIGFIGKIFGYR